MTFIGVFTHPLYFAHSLLPLCKTVLTCYVLHVWLLPLCVYVGLVISVCNFVLVCQLTCSLVSCQSGFVSAGKKENTTLLGMIQESLWLTHASL